MARKKPAPLFRFELANKPLFALGLLLLSSFLAYRIHLLLRLSFRAAIPTVAYSQESSLPAKLDIPSAGINLKIFPTTINNNLWQIDDRGASYLFTSARPGQPGPVILYAHNTKDRFGALDLVSHDDIILLTDELGTTHAYQVSQILTVAPTQIEALLATEETLILYTCTGFLDQFRLVVRAIPI
jgi:LPXTG-site transpeptidase (sortase) family protein